MTEETSAVDSANAAEEARLGGDPARARRIAREALTRARDDFARGILTASLGRAELDQGEAAAASRTLEEAARLLERDPVARAEVELDLGRARRRTGDLDGALEALAQAGERFRQGGRPAGERRAYAGRGKVLYARGDVKGARAAFRAAIDMKGDEPEAWRLHHAIARAYEKEGRHGESERSYKSARDAGWDGRTRDADFAASGGAISGLGTIEPLTQDAPPQKGGKAAALDREERFRLSGPVPALGATPIKPSFGSSVILPPVEFDAFSQEAEALPREDLVRLVTLTGALSSSLGPQPLQELILDRAIEWTGAERGYVVVCRREPLAHGAVEKKGAAAEDEPDDKAAKDEKGAEGEKDEKDEKAEKKDGPAKPESDGGEAGGPGADAGGEPPIDRIEVHVARAAGGTTVQDPEDEISRSIVRQVVLRGEPIFSDDATMDARLQSFTSVMTRKLRSVACVPLRQRRSVLGALYLERRDQAGRFGARERALLVALAHQGAIALDRSLKTTRLEEAYRETRRALDERTGHAFGIVGRARPMRHVFRLIEKVRNHDANVLIEGETGTGKELVARGVHSSSLRREGPFVVESCAALPEGLLEAELFGHEKGAFTGATESRRGAFERGDGGTLFLDEVGDMPARMQALLLRVLETGEVRPLGSPAPRKVDVRIIAAARQDLRSLVRAGRFREDLFFRLNVIRIVVPPLRERKEDLPALTESFLREIGKPASALSPRALEALLRYDWPGNVRELKHAIERASLLAGDGPIDARHLGLEGQPAGPQEREPGAPPGHDAAPSAGKVSFRGHVLNRRQLALIDYLRANGLATNREYVRLVGVSVPTGWRDLKDLLDKGVIRAEGQGRNTVYRLAEGVRDELGTSTTDGM